MPWYDTDDLWWMRPQKSDLPQIASAAFTASFNAAADRRQRQEEFERTLPLRIQQADTQNRIANAEIAGQMLDNEFKQAVAADRTTLKAAIIAYNKGDTSVSPSFLTPQGQAGWEAYKSSTAIGQKLAMDRKQFYDILDNLDAQGRRSVLDLMGNNPNPNSAAWAKAAEEERRVKSEKAPAGGPSEITKLYNDLANARRAGNNELAKALEQEILSKGGKELSQTETGRIGAIEQATKDLDRIESIFNEIDSKFTGPVVGRLRGTVSGYDEKAAILEQAINAATPNLARGVFREVGVLTDEDIKRYKTQFPTLKDTPEIRNAKIKQLRNRLNEGKTGTLEEMKKSGRNVSGFEAGTAQPAAQQFQSEDEARKAGAQTGDIIEIYDPTTARYRKARLK